MTQTSPKSAFAIAGWRYDPTASQEHEGRVRHLGGYVLSLTLQDGENRHHLVHSLRVGTSKDAANRLVVITSIDDMSNPATWVRCLVVSAFAADTPPHCLDDVAFLSADPLNNEGRTELQMQAKRRS